MPKKKSSKITLQPVHGLLISLGYTTVANDLERRWDLRVHKSSSQIRYAVGVSLDEVGNSGQQDEINQHLFEHGLIDGWR